MGEVRYAKDKPSDCAYCYFFSAGRKKCTRKEECFIFFLPCRRIKSQPIGNRVRAVLWQAYPMPGLLHCEGYERSEGSIETQGNTYEFPFHYGERKQKHILSIVCLKSFYKCSV